MSLESKRKTYCIVWEKKICNEKEETEMPEVMHWLFPGYEIQYSSLLAVTWINGVNYLIWLIKNHKFFKTHMASSDFPELWKGFWVVWMMEKKKSLVCNHLLWALTQWPVPQTLEVVLLQGESQDHRCRSHQDLRFSEAAWFTIILSHLESEDQRIPESKDPRDSWTMRCSDSTRFTGRTGSIQI